MFVSVYDSITLMPDCFLPYLHLLMLSSFPLNIPPPSIVPLSSCINSLCFRYVRVSVVCCVCEYMIVTDVLLSFYSLLILLPLPFLPFPSTPPPFHFTTLSPTLSLLPSLSLSQPPPPSPSHPTQPFPQTNNLLSHILHVCQ